MSDRALTIRCRECDSPIELRELAPVVRCGHCGQQHRLDPETMHALEEYRDAVDDQLEQVRKERAVVAAWERSTDQIRRGTKLSGYLLAFGVLVGIPLATILIGIALIQQGVIAKENSLYVNYMAMGATGIAITLYCLLYFARRQRRTKAPEPARSTLRCPECGADNQLEPGQQVESCAHCSAALMPTSTVRDEGIDLARKEARRAALDKYRAERAGYAALRGVGLGPVAVIWFIGGSFLLMVGGGTLVFSWLMLTGEEPYSPAIFVMWGATVALVTGMVVAVRTIRRRQQRTRRAVDGLARSLGGRGLDGLAAAVGWMNEHWAGPRDPYELMPGNYYAVGELSLGGFPILVDVNPTAASQHHRAYSVILVACDVPIGEGGTRPQFDEAAREIERRISAAGYDVEINEAGLIARAGEDVIPGLKQPENIAALAEPIADLARLAAALGATPLKH